MKYRVAFLFSLFLLVAISGFGQEPPFSFLMLTDPQFGMYAADKEFVRETANYEFAVANVNRLKPGFVIVLGDMTNKTGDPDEIREFLRISAKIDSSIPVYYVAGNHDLGRQPSGESLAAYRKNFGRDYYSFRAGPIYGIVLNSALIIDPQKAETEYQEHIAWFKKELEAAKASGAANIIVFEHHPIFLDNVNEQDQYGNFPMERRKLVLDLMHKAGVHYVFAGHLHKNVTVRDGDIEITAVGPVGMSFDGDGSGIRLGNITSKGLKHQYYGFGKMPDTLEIK